MAGSRTGKLGLVLGAIAGASIEWFWTGRTMRKRKKQIEEAQSVCMCVCTKYEGEADRKRAPGVSSVCVCACVTDKIRGALNRIVRNTRAVKNSSDAEIRGKLHRAGQFQEAGKPQKCPTCANARVKDLLCVFRVRELLVFVILSFVAKKSKQAFVQEWNRERDALMTRRTYPIKLLANEVEVS